MTHNRDNALKHLSILFDFELSINTRIIIVKKNNNIIKNNNYIIYFWHKLNKILFFIIIDIELDKTPEKSLHKHNNAFITYFHHFLIYFYLK